MPRLRFSAGPSLTDLTTLEINSDIPLHVKSPGFEGQVAVYIKGLTDASGSHAHSPYFDHKDRKGITWSIQLQGEHPSNASQFYSPHFPICPKLIFLSAGRFLQTHSADDIIFGNIFDRPLKLPWGFGAALKFMRYAYSTNTSKRNHHKAQPYLHIHRYVDPPLQEDLASKSRPWAFSPLVATMPHIHHTRLDDGASPPRFPAPFEPVSENMSQIRTRAGTGRRQEVGPPRHRKQRKAHFKSVERRKDVVFGPGVRSYILKISCDAYYVASPGPDNGGFLPPLS